jgi:hypothetical protein
MRNHDDMDPARAALIDKRLAQAFAFARDVIDEPETLEEIPDGATLLFRDVVWQGRRLRAGWWVSRVTGPAQLAAKSRQWVRPIETRTPAAGGKWSSPAPYPESGPSAEAALDALEEKLRDSDHPGRGPHRATGS